MSEGKNKGRSSTPPAATGTVQAFASQVLSLVASKANDNGDLVRPELLDELIASVKSMDTSEQDAILARFRSFGVQDKTIIDYYIPQAARVLGQDWCEDTLSFADVTIGSARLQGMMRELRAPQTEDYAAPTVLVLIPYDAYHSLGAMVVSDQLRRMGVIVKTALGPKPADLDNLLETHDFDAIFISAATCERLETIHDLVNTVRTAAANVPPIVLGGSVLDQETNLKTLTGADHISNNTEEALRLCGLTTPTPDVASPASRA